MYRDYQSLFRFCISRPGRCLLSLLFGSNDHQRTKQWDKIERNQSDTTDDILIMFISDKHIIKSARIREIVSVRKIKDTIN